MTNKYRFFKHELECMIPWESIEKSLLWYYLNEAPHISPLLYLGHNDIKGVEIYNGDIIRAKASHVIHPQDLHKIADEYVTSVVFWDKFDLRFDTGWNCYSWQDSEIYFEVIGNIYENPELIPL